MKLSCPAFKSDKPDPCRMEVYKAKHEQLRLQHRIQMLSDGWRIVGSEVPIENAMVIGKIDDVFQDTDGRIVATDYVSSKFARMYKLFDAAISAALLRYEQNTYASANVVSGGGIITHIPDDFVDGTWDTMMSRGFQKILHLCDHELLEYANPASGICTYCANKDCRRMPQ